MAKSVYKIPSSLDVSWLDMEFNLQSKQGVGIKRPVSAKVVLSSLLSAFGLLYLVTKTFIGTVGLVYTVPFVLLWAMLSFLLLRADKTKRMGLSVAMTMVDYLPKHNRVVGTRMGDYVYPLQQLTNVSAVDPEDGRIHFLDGAIGYAYHIVGSASSLMFEDDKVAILDKVDSFYRKLPVKVEVIYDTVYEGHSVDEQIQATRQQAKALKSQSPNLRKLLKEKHDILSIAINEHSGLTSLHQYLVVRAPNESALIEFENLLIGDVENSGLMFRLARPLGYEATVKYLRSVFAYKSAS